jgi:hypothetical protein
VVHHHRLSRWVNCAKVAQFRTLMLLVEACGALPAAERINVEFKPSQSVSCAESSYTRTSLAVIWVIGIVNPLTIKILIGHQFPGFYLELCRVSRRGHP